MTKSPEPKAMKSRPLGAATYSFLFSEDLGEALRHLADAGIGLIELTASPPHFDRSTLTRGEQIALRKLIERLGLHVVSLNPTYLDINLASLNTGFREESLRQVKAAVHLCHDLEVEMLVLFAGRRHVLAPAPRELVERVLLDCLMAVLDEAKGLGVSLGLENGPTLLLDRTEDVARICNLIDDPGLRIVYDAANSHMVEDAGPGLSAVLDRLSLVHVSDTTRARWSHAPVGRGDVPFAEVAKVLGDGGYTGPTIMEIIDLDEPLAALTSSATRLAELGWSVAAPGTEAVSSWTGHAAP